MHLRLIYIGMETKKAYNTYSSSLPSRCWCFVNRAADKSSIPILSLFEVDKVPRHIAHSRVRFNWKEEFIKLIQTALLQTATANQISKIGNKALGSLICKETVVQIES